MLIILSSINIFTIMLIKLLNVKNNIKIKILYEFSLFQSETLIIYLPHLKKNLLK